MWKRALTRWVVYLAVAGWFTWPAWTDPARLVPGARRTDLWNSLWAYWFVADSLSDGRVPYRTTLLDHPDGGTILVSDPLGALAALPLVLTAGLPVAYTVVVLLRLALSGVVAHGFAEDLLRAAGSRRTHAAWIAGLGYETAPVLLSGVHNGTSEAIDGAFAALAAWACWRVGRRPGWGRVALAAGALLLAALASWYSAVVAFLFAGFLVLLGGPEGRGRRAAALAAGLALVAPVAWAVHAAATSPDNLVGIKNAREVHTVRRTVGAADPLVYFAPGDYRSPDFRELSRYAEGFLHCHYLGYVLLVGAGLAAVRRRRGTAFLWAAGVAGLVLSLGPVLVHRGLPVIVMGDRAIPLPYILVERLPGFSSLSLLYRLAQAPALAVALLAALGLAGWGRWRVAAVGLLVLAEVRWVSPIEIGVVDVTPDPAIEALAAAAPGAVMNFPVAGGRDYLYEQTVHRKPVAGTLNFPNNLAGRRVWKAMLSAADEPPERFRAVVGREARRRGIRYVVVHVDPMARPDMHDEAVAALKRASDPVAGSEGEAGAAGAGPASLDGPSAVRVYALW